MSIVLQTELKATQFVQNLEEIYASLMTHYQVPHVERRVDSSVTIMFGAYPIKNNSLTYSPHNGQSVTLQIGEVKDTLLKQLFGMTAREMGAKSDAIRKEQGNDVANAYPQSFQAALDNHFGVGVVTLDINTYGLAKVSMKVSLKTLSMDVISAVSQVLMHSELVPKAEGRKIYAI